MMSTMRRSGDLGIEAIESLFMKMNFKHFLKKGAYTHNEFINLISKTPFKKYEIENHGVTLSVYLRKGSPIRETILEGFRSS